MPVNSETVIDSIKSAAHGRWSSVLPAVCGISTADLKPGARPCPKCREGRDRFSPFPDFEETGGVNCRKCMVKGCGDGIATVAWFLDCEMKRAIHILAEYLGLNRIVDRDWNRIRHRVYSAVLRTLPLLARHAKELHSRGLSDEEIATLGYRSLTRGQALVVGTALNNALAETEEKDLRGLKWADLVTSVPGLIWGSNQLPTLCGPEGILIPVRRVDKTIAGLRIRRNKPVKSGKYAAFSGGKKHNQRLPSTVHVPKSTPEHCSNLRITEGEIKADIATLRGQTPTVSIPGVQQWKKALPVVRELGATRVLVAFDADHRTNAAVARSLAELVRKLVKEGLGVAIETWDPEKGKGIDDLLVSGVIPEVVEGGEVEDYLKSYVDPVAGLVGTATVGNAIERDIVYVTYDEHSVNDQVASKLCRDKEIFKRGGRLVRVLSDAELEDGIERPGNQPRIIGISKSTLREKVSRHVEFLKPAEDAETDCLDVRPPQWCINAILDRGDWPNVPVLTGVTTTPVVRDDGSVLTKPGYDPRTGLFLQAVGDMPDLKANPIQDDAIRAAKDLLEVFSDFPFETPAHRSGVLALILTSLARHAFNGPSPLFLIDANVRGSGKTLLVDLVCCIIRGGCIARMPNPGDDDECRKRITALALAGDSFVLIDNIVGTLGCPSLDAALTGTEWKDRKLGVSEMVSLPLYVTWCATGNNVALEGDMSRRVQHIRLESPHENPERRTDFVHEDIRRHVLQKRTDLLGNAITILSAFLQAGKPSQGLPAWGSFTGWSDVVRNAVVWCGEADPGLARQELADVADQDLNAARQIMEYWPDIDPNNEGVTASQIITRLNENPGSCGHFYAALQELCACRGDELPSPRAIGNRFRSIRRRIIGSKCLNYRKGSARIRYWYIASASTAGDSSVSSDSIPDPDETTDSRKYCNSTDVLAPNNSVTEDTSVTWENWDW